MSISDLKDEDGGVAKEFLGLVGLLDVVFGVLLLYGIWLFSPEGLQRLFPSTQSDVVDIALLACAAALVGKLVVLAVAFLLALFRIIDRKYIGENIKAAVDNYAAAVNCSIPPEADTMDAAEQLLAVNAPRQHTEVMRIRSSAMLAYGGGLIAIPYMVQFYRAGSGTLAILCGTAALVSLALGVLYQSDYHRTLFTTLGALTRSSPP
jgi:hypothetical protein